MKKIMFNDKYGLTKAVLEGRKTMTRRIIRNVRVTQDLNEIDEDGDMGRADTRIIIDRFSSYKVGEVVAVAQCYKDAGIDPRMEITHTKWVKSIQKYRAPRTLKFTKNCAKDDFGWENKMYVRADLMPHQIRITNVRVERMRDISDEDCLREGILAGDIEPKMYGFQNGKHKESYFTPKEAFAALIDKIPGKGTWESNPWMFVYEFGLVK